MWVVTIHWDFICSLLYRNWESLAHLIMMLSHQLICKPAEHLVLNDVNTLMMSMQLLLYSYIHVAFLAKEIVKDFWDEIYTINIDL